MPKITQNSFKGKDRELYREGLRAFKNGVTRDKSGIKRKSHDERIWQMGWDAAKNNGEQW